MKSQYLSKIKNFTYNLYLILKNGHYIKQFGFFIKENEIPVYWWTGVGNKNFGDIITPYIVEKISNKKVIWVNKYCFKDFYMITGSILSDASKKSIIWGSGVMSKKQKVNVPKQIFAVRGPLTRQRLLDLNIKAPEVYGDPGLLLPLFYNPPIKKKYKLGIIPHHLDYIELKQLVQRQDVIIINLLDPINKVIEDIISCDFTVSTSLHGIITSHAYGIKSLWIQWKNHIGGDGTKFNDYFLSIGLNTYKPVSFSENFQMEELISSILDNNNDEINYNIKNIQNSLLKSCPFNKKNHL